MRTLLTACTAGLMALCNPSSAAVVSFDTDPFAGSTALTTPGRQIVAGEPSINFSIATDTFAFAPGVFGVDVPLTVVVDVAANLPASGADVIVLLDVPVPFNAGLAANAIAAQVSDPGAGFFIYFNSGLDLPRLVFSTDLSDPTADLKVMARLVNLVGQQGRDQMASFGAGNFALLPEPSSLALLLLPALWAMRRRPR